MIHVQTTTSLVRWYDDGGYEEKSPYRAICSIVHLNDTQVYIHGLHGIMNKADMLELFEHLDSQGVEQIIAERKGKMVFRDIKALIARAKNSKSDLSQVK